MNTRVLVFAGSRSQLLQHIPVERTVRSFRAWEPRLVLSSEKNDHALWAPLLEDYDITPCHRLGPAPASLSDASLLAHIMGSASLLMHREAPAVVLVYGHSVTTMAAALAATELGIPVIHVGAGQLPGNMDSPEGRHAEITDRLATLLCCLDPADERSLHTRLMERGTCVTGDTLYDLFEQDRPRLQPFEEAERHGAAFGEFILCYLSRPEPLHTPEGMRSLLEGLRALHVRQHRPILLVQHPSVLSCFREQQIPEGIRLLPPLPHTPFPAAGGPVCRQACPAAPSAAVRIGRCGGWLAYPLRLCRRLDRCRRHRTPALSASGSAGDQRSGFPPGGRRRDGHPGRHRRRYPSGERRLLSAGGLMLYPPQPVDNQGKTRNKGCLVFSPGNLFFALYRRAQSPGGTMDALMLSQPETVAFGIAMGEKKANAGWVRQLVLAFWAGAFIAFAAEGSNMAAFNLLARPETYGLGKCLAGTIFPVGLMLVMLTGAELFTGNTLMCMALAEKRIPLTAMLRNWLFVYIGNFLGSIFLAHMIVTSGQLASGAGMLGGVTLRIAAGKVALDFLPAFYLGLMCNWLVCLAVWFCWSARSQTGKMLGIFFPIWLFITSGFEHSVANMYYIPAGIMAAGNELFAKASGLSAEALASLTWSNFAINNLIPVTLGNIAGGALFVGMIHWWTHRGALSAKQNH